MLVDAPCSSTGALRRRPGLRWDISEAACAAGGALPSLQRALVAQAAGKLRAGGRLVYATCSALKSENGAD